MQSRIVAQRPPPVLLLDADTQTDSSSTMSQTKPTPQVVSETVADQISSIHVNLVARINELELQNAELQDSVDEIRNILSEFKRMWESKSANEKKTDVLLRNIGVIS